MTETYWNLISLPAKAVDLAVVVHAVIFEDGQLDLLVLVFDLLGGRVILLLALLATAAQAEHQVKCRLCKDGQLYFTFGKFCITLTLTTTNCFHVTSIFGTLGSMIMN